MLFAPSFLIGILIPCVAKHLLSAVLSHTPGNFLALNTWNGSLKTEARIGALDWLIPVPELEEPEEGRGVGRPTFTKENWSLLVSISLLFWLVGKMERGRGQGR